jgi:hypothetical protein
MAASGAGKTALAIVALVISAGALGVSAIAYFGPIAQAAQDRDASIRLFLKAITRVGTNAVLEAKTHTVESSSADTYVSVLADIWRSRQAGAEDGLKAGHWSKRDDTYDVCFPKGAVIGTGCQTFADFQFGENSTEISRFSIDSLPVDSLAFRQRGSIDTESYSVEVDLTAVLVDPVKHTKTIAFRSSLSQAETYPVGTSFSLQSMRAQNEKEEWLDDPHTVLESSISRYESAWGASRMDQSANLIEACWSVPSDSSPCGWLNLSLASPG